MYMIQNGEFSYRCIHQNRQPDIPLFIFIWAGSAHNLDFNYRAQRWAQRYRDVPFFSILGMVSSKFKNIAAGLCVHLGKTRISEARQWFWATVTDWMLVFLLILKVPAVLEVWVLCWTICLSGSIMKNHIWTTLSAWWICHGRKGISSNC